jgi:hypothetical protein
VSDSRLSGDGRTFDAAPKILTLPRSDCAIAFAGKTQDAFPMMLQLSLSINSHAPARRRSLDVTALRAHVINLFNGMAPLIQSDLQTFGSVPDAKPDAEFLFGGYSWTNKQFEFWRFEDKGVGYISEAPLSAYFSPGARSVQIRSLRKPRQRSELLGRIAFAGDQSKTACELLKERLTADYLSGKIAGKIDMQPFEIVRDMLRSAGRSHTIGGAPQLVKVYQFMQTISFPIYWPDKQSGNRYLQGRPCMSYERLDTKVVDPDIPAWSQSESDTLVREP